QCGSRMEPVGKLSPRGWAGARGAVGPQQQPRRHRRRRKVGAPNV
ncbi:uncharacterized protein METZ01_LOCUS450335, partial [marine metagenome]